MAGPSAKDPVAEKKFLPTAYLCRGPTLGKPFFAESPTFGSRQRRWLLATALFLVVIWILMRRNSSAAGTRSTSSGSSSCLLHIPATTAAPRPNQPLSSLRSHRIERSEPGGTVDEAGRLTSATRSRSWRPSWTRSREDEPDPRCSVSRSRKGNEGAGIPGCLLPVKGTTKN